MKLSKFGQVIVKEDAVEVSKFELEVTPEELTTLGSDELNSRLATLAVEWALTRLQGEVNRAKTEAFKRLMAEKKPS